LRRRLLDVDFVINRAAVFAGVSLVVVGIFVLVEFLFNKFLGQASHTTSIIFSIGIALTVGISLQYIHHYVDKIVDRVFFRARHDHEQALRTFAHEAAFITNPDTLLDSAVREVSTHAETDDVSILVRDERGNFTTARSTNGAVESVSENDRAILKLRAWHNLIDLGDLDTVLHGSRAFPLISRGDLLGVLVCGGKRDGQPYAPDENEALSMLARSVGSALDGIRRERRDDLKAAIDDLGVNVSDLSRGMVEIRDALRDLSPSANGNLPIPTVQPPTG
jgi:GAF domain-containing protein